jgi:hypothetical protein
VKGGNMFGPILQMMGNYENRVVDRYEGNGMVVDTAAVTDGKQPYETGLAHPEYNKGNYVIVEAYDTKEEAKKGHAKWVKKMTAKSLPKSLIDCQNAAISQLCAEMGAKMEFPREKQ